MSYLALQLFFTCTIWYLCSPPPNWVLSALGISATLTGILLYVA